MLGKHERYNLDIAPIVPEAQSIVRDATGIYLQHLSQWCIGVLVHGSALKGGYISGGSDVDLQLYLEPSAFNSNGDLALELCIAIQRDLSKIDPTPFQYIQGYALPPYPRKGFSRPIPGAYHMVAGRLPVPEATEDELQIAARHALDPSMFPGYSGLKTFLNTGYGNFLKKSGGSALMYGRHSIMYSLSSEGKELRPGNCQSTKQ